MSYPLSADVASGDVTAAAHYNTLRSDALRLGQLAADAVNIGAVLESYESKLTIVRQGTTQLRVAASASAPVALIIDGVPVRTVANVDLAIGDIPSGAAATWYIFANRTAGSTSFTLSVAASNSPSANQRRIGQCYWDGSAIVKDSIQTEFAILLKSLLYFKDTMTVSGRLTLSTADPTPVSDIASSATLYFTPYLGNRVSLYVPVYGWRVYEFTELSLDISGLTTATNYDIFLYDKAGTLTLEELAWSNATLRATALYNQDGRWVKTNAKDRLYLGTIRTSGAGVCADTVLLRYVWNNYNRVNRTFKVIETTANWTYATSGTKRPLNNNTANKVQFIVGLAEDPIWFQADVRAQCGTGATRIGCGIGYDSTSVNSASGWWFYYGADNYYSAAQAIYNTYSTIGFHYLMVLEFMEGTTSTQFYGHDDFYGNSGGHGWMKA